MGDLDEKTKIPFWWVVVAFFSFFSVALPATLWMASVASDAREAKDGVKDVRQVLTEVRDSVLRLEQVDQVPTINHSHGGKK